jgi:calmodulin
LSDQEHLHATLVPPSAKLHFIRKSELTEEQVAEYKEGFRLFTQGDTGKVQARQVGLVLRSLGLNPSNADVTETVGENPPEDKLLDFTEFLSIAAQQKSREKTIEEDLKQAFKIFDRTGSGEIALSELKAILTSIGEAVSADDFDRLLSENDVKSSTLKLDEFLKLLLAK